MCWNKGAPKRLFSLQLYRFLLPRSIIVSTPMVRDGYFYGIGSAVAVVLIAWLAAWPYAVPVILIGVFCLWFFRDPERQKVRLIGVIMPKRGAHGFSNGLRSQKPISYCALFPASG